MGGIRSLGVVDDKLTAALADESPRVRMFAALELGKRKPPAAVDALVKMLADNNDADPVLRFAGIAGLAGCASPEALAAMATHQSRAVRLAAVVALRRLSSPLVGKYLGDRDPLVVLEAARAIHDVPIVEAFPALAEFVKQPVPEGDDGDALFRRVLNANFRLGSIDGARRLANFASSEQSVPDSLRIEALEMLGAWAKPSGATVCWECGGRLSRAMPRRRPTPCGRCLASCSHFPIRFGRRRRKWRVNWELSRRLRS